MGRDTATAGPDLESVTAVAPRASERADGLAGPRRISVIIANYNHEAHVGEAIESALALDWPDVEVIVVDDGSTDDSLEVIQRYADRATVLATENATQRVAANRGFALSTGDVVVFLDADDVLPPELAHRVAAVWRPGVSKVQFQARPIGPDGAPVSAPYPAYQPVPSAHQITRWARETSAYPTPPGSANAYARWYLERIFPLPASIGVAADSGCLAVAPHVGEVVALEGVYIGYRWSQGQLSDLLSRPERFAREVSKARARWRLAQRTLGVPEDQIDEGPLFRSRELLQFRVAAHRLADRRARAQPVLAGDGLRTLWRDVLLSPTHPGPEGLRHRMLVAVWSAVTLACPSPFVMTLLRMRYRRS